MHEMPVPLGMEQPMQAIPSPKTRSIAQVTHLPALRLSVADLDGTISNAGGIELQLKAMGRRRKVSKKL